MLGDAGQGTVLVKLGGEVVAFFDLFDAFPGFKTPIGGLGFRFGLVPCPGFPFCARSLLPYLHIVCKIVLPIANDLLFNDSIVVMTAQQEKIFWRPCVSLLLAAAVLLVSLGAHSVAFHTWFHGGELDCSLVHHTPASETPTDGSTGGAGHEHGDPLEPFCQGGYLLQASLEISVLERPRVFEPIVRHSPGFALSSLCASRPTRAPPVLI